MKRSLFILFCLCTLSAVVFAEEDTLVGTFEKVDNYYILKGEDSLTKMDKEAYLRFIHSNCPEAWNSYQKGTRLWKAGWGLLGAGIGVEFLIGVPMFVTGYCHFLDDEEERQHKLLMAGGAMVIGLGSAMELGSIPLLVVGGIKRNNTYEVYNEQCRQQQNTLYLSMQASSNGIGLALKF